MHGSGLLSLSQIDVGRCSISNSFSRLFQNNYVTGQLEKKNWIEPVTLRHSINGRYCSSRKYWDHVIFATVNTAYVCRNTLWVSNMAPLPVGHQQVTCTGVGQGESRLFVCSSEERKPKQLVYRRHNAAQLVDISFKMHRIWNMW